MYDRRTTFVIIHWFSNDVDSQKMYKSPKWNLMTTAVHHESIAGTLNDELSLLLCQNLEVHKQGVMNNFRCKPSNFPRIHNWEYRQSIWKPRPQFHVAIKINMSQMKVFKNILTICISKTEILASRVTFFNFSSLKKFIVWIFSSLIRCSLSFMCSSLS